MNIEKSIEILKLIENAVEIKDEDSLIFDELYIIPQIELHDSGYHTMTIYGKRIDENKFYKLTTFSDVIHFEKMNEISWFCSMDIPYFGIIRLFPRGNYKFLIPFTYISDFTVNFCIKEN